MSRVTVSQLAEMISEQSNTMQKMYELFDARLNALENAPTKSVAKKAVNVQKPKASTTTTNTIDAQYDAMQKSKKPVSTEPKWVLNKKCVYSAPNEFISKKARYAFKMQAQENGGSTLSAEQRETLVKMTKDKYTTAMVFKTEKDAKAFYTKWMA